MSKKLLTALYCISISHFAIASQDLVTQEIASQDLVTQESINKKTAIKTPVVSQVKMKVSDNDNVSSKVADGFANEVNRTQQLGYLKAPSAKTFSSAAKKTIPKHESEKNVVKTKKVKKKVKKIYKKKKAKIAREAPITQAKEKKLLPKIDNVSEEAMESTSLTVGISNKIADTKQSTVVEMSKPNVHMQVKQPNEEPFDDTLSKVKDEVNEPSAISKSASIVPQTSVSHRHSSNALETSIIKADTLENVSQTNASLTLDFSNGEVELSENIKASMQPIIENLQTDSKLVLKLHSFGFVENKGVAESRRVSLQRAIKVRKFLIENEVNPNSISVNATEDAANKSNRVELLIEKVS